MSDNLWMSFAKIRKSVESDCKKRDFFAGYCVNYKDTVPKPELLQY